MKTFGQLREGYASYAQQKAAHASMAERGKKKKKEDTSDSVKELDTSTLVSYRKKANKQRFSSDKKTSQRTTGVDMANKKLRARNIDKFGKHSPKGVDKMGNPKEDTSDAVKAFLAKGGKIKKLPPAKAQGYHGKDDPGKDVRGMLDKPDTKKSVMGTRKKAKSMEALIIRSKKPASKLRRDAESRPTGVREISKAKLGRYMKKVPASAAQAGDMMARPTPGAPGSAATMDKGVKKFVKRTKGAAMAADKLTGKAKVPAK